MKLPRFQTTKPKAYIALALLLAITIICITSQTLCSSSTPVSVSAVCPLSGGQHVYSEWLTIQNQTCTRAQVETRSCACGYGTIRRTNELGHQNNTSSIVKSPTCNTPGYQESMCARCHKVSRSMIEATGHSWSDWRIVQEQSCTQDKMHERVCHRCDQRETIATALATGHNWSAWQLQQSQTCTQDEIQVRICNTCHTTEQNVTPAMGHQYDSFQQLRAPTCQKSGQKQRVCQVCAYIDTQKIGKIPHTYKNGQCTSCGTDDPSHWPKTYQDKGVKIVIHKVEGYGRGNTTCYVAEVQLTDYTRFFTACGKNKYGGQSSTSAAAKKQNAVLAINGCYSAPYLNYTVVRRGIIHNGADNNAWGPAVYSSKTGILQGTDNKLNPMIAGKQMQSLVEQGLVTDTFCFGPPILVNNIVTGTNDGGRAQRTFIGTNGKPGHLLLCVSNGRYSDGKSAGLTYKEMGQLMKEYGCTFGVPLDGGGSSTMVFKGKVLNQLADGKERNWIVDFCCVSYQ